MNKHAYLAGYMYKDATEPIMRDGQAHYGRHEDIPGVKARVSNERAGHQRHQRLVGADIEDALRNRHNTTPLRMLQDAGGAYRIRGAHPSTLKRLSEALLEQQNPYRYNPGNLGKQTKPVTPTTPTPRRPVQEVYQRSNINFPSTHDRIMAWIRSGASRSR